MTWLKYDSAPILIGEQFTRDQPRELSAYSKPNGFWITDDTDDCWRTWCLSNRFNIEGLTHKHEVILDDARILVLRSADAVEVFARQYRAHRWWGPTDNPRAYCDRCIDWRRVATEHAGIIITPYQWSLRLERDFRWYYGWDCASGCIWDASAIIDIRLIDIDHDIASKARPAFLPELPEDAA